MVNKKTLFLFSPNDLYHENFNYDLQGRSIVSPGEGYQEGTAGGYQEGAAGGYQEAAVGGYQDVAHGGHQDGPHAHLHTGIDFTNSI